VARAPRARLAVSSSGISVSTPALIAGLTSDHAKGLGGVRPPAGAPFDRGKITTRSVARAPRVKFVWCRMYARVLFSWPVESPYRPLTDEVGEMEPEIVNALTRIIDLVDAREDSFAPRSIPLSPEAVEAFERFRDARPVLKRTAVQSIGGRSIRSCSLPMQKVQKVQKPSEPRCFLHILHLLQVPGRSLPAAAVALPERLIQRTMVV
jgi:hypothetical protein